MTKIVASICGICENPVSGKIQKNRPWGVEKQMTDEELDTLFLQDVYRRLEANDATALDDLLHRVSGRLERLARKMLRGFPGVRRWEETADVLQAALIRLMRAVEQVRPDSSRAFIGLAAEQIRRTLIDLARHYQGPEGHGAHHASGVLQRDAEQSAAPFDPADRRAGTEELERWRLFHESIERLPVTEREVFSLSFYHGWKQSEIAEHLQVSERTVRRFWQSACDQLRDLTGGELPFE